MKSGQDFGFYIRVFAHEFIHADMSDKYVNSYGFLHPEDYAFQQVMEEAFGNAIEYWAYMACPDIHKDPNLRDWWTQPNTALAANAMCNDIKADGSHLSAEQINDEVVVAIFQMFLTRATNYTEGQIPNNMSTVYGHGNTFLIPEYAASRERGDALLAINGTTWLR